jgi:hypothetical protein
LSILPVRSAAGIDTKTVLEGEGICQLPSGYVTGMAVKHLFSVSLEDVCLTRLQLASLAALLSTDDKNQHSSDTKYKQKILDVVHQ